MPARSIRTRLRELRRDVHALSLAARDERTPRAAKALIVLLAAYVASPIDPIPDVIPVVGYLDELVLVPLGVALALRLVPDAVMADCRERADDAVDAGAARWLVAGLTVLAWVAIAIVAARLLA